MTEKLTSVMSGFSYFILMVAGCPMSRGVRDMGTTNSCTDGRLPINADVTETLATTYHGKGTSSEVAEKPAVSIPPTPSGLIGVAKRR